MSELTPGYLDVDFNTFKARLKDQLQISDVFRDYNYEGSNIAILIELMAYISDLSTFFINKIAKNVYMDTADIYETVHMLSRLRGYNPSGYRSAKTTITVTIPSGAGVSLGDTLYIPAWKEISCPDLTDSDGNIIKFATNTYLTETISTSASWPITIDIPVRQGEVLTYSYTGNDLIDNRIYLPLYDFDYDDDLDDEYPSIEVTVDDEIWERIPDIYDEISGLSSVNNVYSFRYNRYQKYLVEFYETRNVPEVADDIEITLLKTLGADGEVGTGSITTPETEFIYNRNTKEWLDNSEISVTNTATTTSSASRETISEIKDASLGNMHSQYRNVTVNDYERHLESRSDIDVAHVWGEQEIAPSGDVEEYNKVYISVIPSQWGDSTISTSASSASDDILIPVAFSDTFKELLSTYLEPRKMICTYEEYYVPELVYFCFDIGIQIKRTYSFEEVSVDVRNKLEYFFDNVNRDFNETIGFLEVINFIEDLTITDEESEDEFENVAGIQNLVIRNIDIIDKTVYEPNETGNYPYYTVDEDTYAGENRLRDIKLGFNQFPAIYIDGCTFTEEIAT
jgi:hypothetical protein